MDTLLCFERHFCKYPESRHRPVAFTTKGGYVPQFIRVFIPSTHDTILFTTVLYFIRLINLCTLLMIFVILFCYFIFYFVFRYVNLFNIQVYLCLLNSGYLNIFFAIERHILYYTLNLHISVNGMLLNIIKIL